MKNRGVQKRSHGLRTFILFGLIVLAIITIALLYRSFAIIKESKFDSQHRFTVMLEDNKNAYALISFEPVTNSISLLRLSKNLNLPKDNANKFLGIIPNATIKTQSRIEIDRPLRPILQKFIFKKNIVSSDLTIFDLFQIWYFSYKIPQKTISVEEISRSSDPDDINKSISKFFSDSEFSKENISIQIINASGASGLGGRLERVISNLGGNVVSVRTSVRTQQKSSIQYYGEDSYTLKTIKSILPFDNKRLTRQPIAQIIITVGVDMSSTNLF